MSIEIFRLHADIIHQHYLTLSLIDSEREPSISGSLPIYDNAGILLFTFQIKIKYVPGYPFEFPHVFETDNAFPHIADWHCYSDGMCCLTTKINELIFCDKGLAPLKFMKEIVVSYFANQEHRRTNGFYLHGEFSHGPKGNLESYKELLGIDNTLKVINIMRMLIAGSSIFRFQTCPICGGEKVRSCHLKIIQLLQRNEEQMLNDLIEFKKYFPKEFQNALILDEMNKFTF